MTSFPAEPPGLPAAPSESPRARLVPFVRVYDAASAMLRIGSEIVDAAGAALPRPRPPAVGTPPGLRPGMGLGACLCVGGGGGGGGGVGAALFGLDGGTEGGGGGGAMPKLAGVRCGTDAGGDGGGGGATAGLPVRKAFRAACSARFGSLLKPLTGGNGGGGGAEGMPANDAADRSTGGSRGAPDPGKGGADDGARLDESGGGGGADGIDDAVDEGFRDEGGGIGGFLPIGGGGLGLEMLISGLDCVPPGVGLRLCFNAATDGICGAAAEGGKGGTPPGALKAFPTGGGGGALGAPADDFLAFVSGSESYMFTPPALFRNFGMPPANSPPSCGAESIPGPGPLPRSLLLRPRFGIAAVGGRRPGTGGAPPAGGPVELEGLLSIIGADRSLIWPTFLSFAPLVMSPSRAP